MTGIYIVAIATHVVASAALFVFGVNLARFSLLAWRHRQRPLTLPSAVLGEELDVPMVTVQLPIYNELYVAARAIEAACRLDYPQDRLQIQVLDDSDDETSAVVVATIARCRAAGAQVEHLRRPNRTGYKAGALAAGLMRARGSLIAIFDADFVPPRDFLTRTVPYFAEPSIAFVQGRWGHLNGEYSWLTRLQVPAIDGHFLVEQRARGLGGHWFNFNGTAGVWRAEAIADAGGWHHDTLTEDLDLSYRAHLRGWQGRYLPDLVVPGELPAQLSGFRRQQRRWARGSLECAAKLLVPIWRSDAPLGVKFQATMHLGAYGVHLLLIVLVLSYPLVLLGTEAFGVAGALYGAGYLLAPASVSPALFLGTGQALQGRAGWRRARAVAGMIVFGSGLMVNTGWAVLDIFLRPRAEFERTPKYGLDTEGGSCSTPRVGTARYRRGLDRIVVAEAALGSYALATAVLAYTKGSWGIVTYSALFATGLLAVAGADVAQTVAERRHRALSVQPPDVAAEREGALSAPPVTIDVGPR
ncbi:MAG: glycosyltransferase family 2 protein [Acidimicrobiia bacterium]|nr:glycosyltransferase family 2 protein [Acidimicrobiia bacterium]